MINNVQWGTVAEWFTGFITAAGIFIAIRQSKIRVSLRHRIINKNVILEVHNESNFKIEVNHVYVYYYANRFKKGPIGPLGMYDRYLSEDGIITLKPHETNQFESLVELYNYKKKHVYIVYGCVYQGGLVKEIKIRRKISVSDFQDN